MGVTFIELLILTFVSQTLTYTLLFINSGKHTPNTTSNIRPCKDFLIMFPLLLLFICPVFFIYREFSLAGATLAISISAYVLMCALFGERFPLKIFSYSLVVLPLSVFITMGNTYPSIEEGRFLGFAENIISKGHWYPFTFYDNDYYQFFHVAANYLALQIIVTGMNPFILRKVIVISLSTFMLILANVICRKATGVNGSPLATPFVIISAPLALLFTVYGNGPLGTILALFAIAALLSLTDYRVILILTIVSIIGVLTHPVYSLYSVPILLVLVLFNRRRDERKLHVACLLTIVMITILYWIFSVVLERILIKVVSDYWKILTNFFVQPLHKFATYTPWYDNVTLYNRLLLAISWTLIPSFAASYLIVKFMSRIVSKRLFFGDILHNKTGLLAFYSFTMLAVPLLWYLIMKSSTMGLGFGHFYGFIFFLIPAASVVALPIIKRRKTLSLMIILLFVGLATYGVMQDPHYNPTSPILGLSTERDWIVGTTLSKFIEQGVISQSDFRLASPSLYVAALTGKLKYKPAQTYEHKELYLITVAYDKKGIACIERAYFFRKHVKLKNLILSENYSNNVNVVYNDGLYRSLLVKLMH